MTDYSYLTEEELAIEYLSNNLEDGVLALFIGAGASTGLGLPPWHELINRLDKQIKIQKDAKYKTESYVPIVSATTSADDLQKISDRLASQIDNEQDFLNLFEKALYGDSDKTLFNIDSLLHNELLMALGALMIGGKRGKISNIISLNYDSVLEWFLSIYGYTSNIIYSLPKLEGNEDVRVYHPHGFVPHPELSLERSNFLILGLDSVSDRLGSVYDPWFEKMRHLMRSNIMLFVGLSYRTFTDYSLRTLINNVSREVGDSRPLGFWLMLDKISEDEIKEMLRKSIIPITFKDKSLIPKFLFNICTHKVKII